MRVVGHLGQGNPQVTQVPQTGRTMPSAPHTISNAKLFYHPFAPTSTRMHRSTGCTGTILYALFTSIFAINAHAPSSTNLLTTSSTLTYVSQCHRWYSCHHSEIDNQSPPSRSAALRNNSKPVHDHTPNRANGPSSTLHFSRYSRDVLRQTSCSAEPRWTNPIAHTLSKNRFWYHPTLVRVILQLTLTSN